MSVRFDYEVSIQGIEHVPLRTTKDGVKALMKAFDNGDTACDTLLKAMKDNGLSFTNNLVSVKLKRKPNKKKTVATAKKR